MATPAIWPTTSSSCASPRKPVDDGGTTYYRITDGKIDTTPLTEVGLDDSQTTNAWGFTADGKTLYWTDARNRNTAALIAQDVATGKNTVIAEDARADIGGALPDKNAPAACWPTASTT